MASPQIRIKRTAVAGRVPTTAQLELGELAINTTDGKLFLKRNLNSVESIIDVGASSTLAGNNGEFQFNDNGAYGASPNCLLYTSPSPRDLSTSRMPSSA